MIRIAFALMMLLVPYALPAMAQQKPTIKFGYAKCAHCTPIALTPEYAPDAKIEAIAFNTGNDVLAALVSKSIDVAQITYQHYAIALDKGFDVVAISGQINGGSQMVLANDVPVKPNDWDALKALIHEGQGGRQAVQAWRPAAGNAQDLHMRGEFKPPMASTSTRTSNSSTSPIRRIMRRALRRGEVDLICHGGAVRNADPAGQVRASSSTTRMIRRRANSPT